MCVNSYSALWIKFWKIITEYVLNKIDKENKYKSLYKKKKEKYKNKKFIELLLSRVLCKRQKE